MRMGNLIIFSLYFISADPSLAGSYGEAVDNARRAFLLTESGQKVKDQAEDFGKDLIRDYIDEDKAKYLIIAAPLVTGEISTRPFKNIGWTGDGWQFRPEVTYKFSGEYSTNLNLDSSF